MKKINNWLEQAYFYQDKGTLLSGAFSLKKSLERALIIGGTTLTILGFGNAIRSSHEYENQPKVEERTRPDYEGGISSLFGFLGFAGMVVGSCLRDGRRQFEKDGFVID